MTACPYCGRFENRIGGPFCSPGCRDAFDMRDRIHACERELAATRDELETLRAAFDDARTQAYHDGHEAGARGAKRAGPSKEPVADTTRPNKAERPEASAETDSAVDRVFQAFFAARKRRGKA
jgi:hypothetical protein